jgi:hypothetical protein
MEFVKFINRIRVDWSSLSKKNYIKQHSFYFLIFFAYFFIAILMTYPLITNITSFVPCSLPWCDDNWNFIWVFWWFKKSLIDLNTNPLYSNYIFYPEGANLLFFSSSPFNAILSVPLQIFFGVIPAYNILVLFAIILNAIGMYLLVNYLTKDTKASFISGIVFGFSSYNLARIFYGHINTISAGFIPLYILYLLKIFEDLTIYLEHLMKIKI